MTASVANKRRTNLPADVTRFVGRRRQLAEVREVLQQARIVTLTGLGGVGKTRLALRVAADARRAFADGVWLVELAALRDSALVGHTVAAVLGSRQDATQWSLATLADLIDDRQILLVLDNCEHVLDAVAVLADALLRACPGLRILTTSRQPLRIAGEHCIEVEPLATPDDRAVLSLASTAGCDAVSLFVERATAVRPGFRLDEGNAATVARICQRLDGIPLALELAAGRLRTLSVEQLLSRLNSRYQVLIGGSPAALPRQQTMRALIDWSWALCTSSEQLLWARLSVFPDGFSLECIEEVCSDQRLPPSAILDTLDGLVDKSIVFATQPGGAARFWLPETLREYAAERLAESGEVATIERRARDWCTRLVRRFQNDWFGPEQVELLRTLRLEHATIAAALNYCLSDVAEVGAGLEIAAGLRFYWTTSGRLSDGRHWLDRLLDLYQTPDPTRLAGLCVDAYLTSGHKIIAPDIAHMLDEAEALAGRLREDRGTAQVAQTRGAVHLLLEEPEASVAPLERAVVSHRQLGDTGAIAYDLILLAVARSAIGKPDVEPLLTECVLLCRAASENWMLAVALWTLGVQCLKAGDLAAAAAAQTESIQLRMPLNAGYLIAQNLDALARVAVESGDHDRGARLFGAADAIMRDTGAAIVSRGPTGSQHADGISRSRVALGDAKFDRAYHDGMAMAFDDAVAYALGASTPPLGSAASTNTPDPAPLTPREFEVAQLVARGLTNKQIAAALIISQRTAEGHVEHVLTKLGFTSRAQIAVWTAEHQPAE